MDQRGTESGSGEKKKTSGWIREHGSIKQTRDVMAKEVTE